MDEETSNLNISENSLSKWKSNEDLSKEENPGNALIIPKILVSRSPKTDGSFKMFKKSEGLKYSHGIVHNVDKPASFDHNYDHSEDDMGFSVNASPAESGEDDGNVGLDDESQLSHRTKSLHTGIPKRPIRHNSSLRRRNSLLPAKANFNIEETLDLASRDNISPRSQNESHISKSKSMYSLAMPISELSAIAVHPISVRDARTRSYLLGSLGQTSFLGSEELDRLFPDKKIRVFCGTWNMNGQIPPHRLADFLLPTKIGNVPDLLAIGTQETFHDTFLWECHLQETLGPSHVLFTSHNLGVLHLAIFIRRDIMWFCSMPEADSFSTRPGAQFKTKGAVAIAFLFFGTSFLFINSHLTAHEMNVKDRVRDFKKITAMLNVPKLLPIKKTHRDVTHNFDCVFWCGDLNFRLTEERQTVIRDVGEGLCVLETDQLNWLKNKGTIFRGFQEHEIKFRPSYKYDTGTNSFDSSAKQRTPSYTDRILFKCRESCAIKSLHYDSVQAVVTSDHKPVWGTYEVKIRPGKDNIPLSGGLFNREVYLEGIKRRSEALIPIKRAGQSNQKCSIQ